MATYEQIAEVIIEQEGSMLPGSVNMTMVSRYGYWNVGHLVWAGQRGAVPVRIGSRTWAGWPTYEEAYAGLVRQIRLDASRGMTLSQFVSKYAPAYENRTDDYIAYVSSRTGIPPDGVMADYIVEQVQYAKAPAEVNEVPLWDGWWGSNTSDNPSAAIAVLAGGALLAVTIAAGR